MINYGYLALFLEAYYPDNSKYIAEYSDEDKKIIIDNCNNDPDAYDGAYARIESIKGTTVTPEKNKIVKDLYVEAMLYSLVIMHKGVGVVNRYNYYIEKYAKIYDDIVAGLKPVERKLTDEERYPVLKVVSNVNKDPDRYVKRRRIVLAVIILIILIVCTVVVVLIAVPIVWLIVGLVIVLKKRSVPWYGTIYGPLLLFMHYGY
jgi:hypothetical protein